MSNERWDDATLDDLRWVGDEPADALAREIGNPFPRLVHRLMNDMTLNAAPLPDGLPTRLRAFLEEAAVLPPWADAARIEAGQRLFSRYGPLVVLALTCGALPECYAAAQGAQILNLSSRMRRNPHRRILETAQLVLDVMAPGGLSPEGRGVRTTQKVRLLHAVLRPHLARNPLYNETWGEPINQEDMLGTLMSFSAVVLDCLARLGVGLSDEEEDGYLHAWLVVGHLLGIDSRHFPANPTEARAFATIVRRRHHARSDAGRELARALVNLMEQALPGTVLDGFAQVLIRHLVGDRVADILELDPQDWTRALLWPLRVATGFVDAVTDAVPPLARATELFSRKFLEGVYMAEQGAEPVQFHIPPQLAERWGVHAPQRGAATPIAAAARHAVSG